MEGGGDGGGEGGDDGAVEGGEYTAEPDRRHDKEEAEGGGFRGEGGWGGIVVVVGLGLWLWRGWLANVFNSAILSSAIVVREEGGRFYDGLLV